MGPPSLWRCSARVQDWSSPDRHTQLQPPSQAVHTPKAAQGTGDPAEAGAWPLEPGCFLKWSLPTVRFSYLRPKDSDLRDPGLQSGELWGHVRLCPQTRALLSDSIGT